jgi:hypothetical protein
MECEVIGKDLIQEKGNIKEANKHNLKKFPG